ncbi:MAG TPA: serine hydrolase domain-containing protein [Kofleriaceae bacterium]|nr:serine hydrolase domain-containing protein [Kofleriaceae bacterium]
MRVARFVLLATVLACSARERTSSPPALRAARAAAATATPAAAAATPAAPTATPAAPTAIPARQLPDEITIMTRSGAALLAPKGWWLTHDGEVLLLEDPDRTLKVWLLETREPDAARAIAAAWQRVAPGFHLAAVGTPDTPPPTGGWDAIMDLSYDTGSGERLVRASARRYRELTHVTLLDGDRAAMSRRGAQLAHMLDSLHPEGMRDESFAGHTPQPIDVRRARELDAFIQDALSRLEVPGAAVAIVRGGAVVYERAFGVRELGKPAPVTVGTLFLIGSITKSMTTMMQATLVDAGLLRWDTPVVSVLPSFALGDAELTRNVLLWHMSCACTGMPRNDLENIFEYDHVSAEQRIASMRLMKPTTALGEAFQYSNLMVAAGGFAAAHAYAPTSPLGDAYDAAMRRKIFGPIGMASTTLDFAAATRADHAIPHATTIDGAVRAVPIAMERNVLPIRPAGGVWSSLHDMERYVRTELAGGVAPNGRRVVSEANLKARRLVRIGDATTGGYGLGLGIRQLHGLTVVSHDGGSFGFGTSMFMLPDQGIAIIVLTNVRSRAPTEDLPFNAAVVRRIIETIFDRARPLAALQLAYFAKGRAELAARALEHLQRVPDFTRMNQLAGTYTNPSLGALTLTATTSGAMIDAGEWSNTLGQRGPTTLVLLDPPFAGGELTVGGSDANPTLSVAYDQMTYVFTRDSKHPSN